MSEYQFRVRYALQGGHVHCRFFSRKMPGSTFAKLGEFVVTKGAEFRDLVVMMDAGPVHCEFVQEEDGRSGGMKECCAP